MAYVIQVYKIYFDDCDDVYIGSTKSPLSRRMAQHRSDTRKGSKCRVHNLIREKDMVFNYVLVKSCIVDNKDQQRQFEQHVIDEIHPSLNQVRAYRTEKQHNDYHKEHYKENKELILRKKKAKIHCVYCDNYGTAGHVAVHNRTTKHKKNMYFHYLNFIHS